MTEKTYLLEDHCSWLTMQRKVTQVIVRDIYLVKKRSILQFAFMAIEIEGKYQQRYLVGVLAVIDV